MKRRHAITPTDRTPAPNPLWERVAPRAATIETTDAKGRTRRIDVVEVDAMVLTELDEHYRLFGIEHASPKR